LSKRFDDFIRTYILDASVDCGRIGVCSKFSSGHGTIPHSFLAGIVGLLFPQSFFCALAYLYIGGGKDKR